MRSPSAALPLSLLLSILLVSCSGAPKETDAASRPDTVSKTPPTDATQSTAKATSQPAEAKSVKPGINKRFKDPNMDVGRAMKMFEGESREIFIEKVKIAKTLDLADGEDMADIGSGTGLFLPYFTKGVGAKGKVYAVEISPKFVEHIQALSKKKKWSQVETVFCTDKSTKLAEASIDAAFICDTYHHFEYPQATLASIRKAMRPGGRLVIVDFKRIPGESRKWILGHVRCNKETVIQEVTAAGFVYVDEIQVKGLRENYLIRFKRP